jgi:hypothetical protein
MDSACHVIKYILNHRFLSQMASFDVSSSILPVPTEANAGAAAAGHQSAGPDR